MPRDWTPAGKVYRVVVNPQAGEGEGEMEYPGERRRLMVAGGAGESALPVVAVLGPYPSLRLAPRAVRLEVVFAHTPNYPDEPPLLKVRG